jgi:hypothetical protein
MAFATEYRDAYCWFIGGVPQPIDRWESMVQQKIAGTYTEPPRGPPKFAFEQRLSEQPRVVPNTDGMYIPDSDDDAPARRAPAGRPAPGARPARRPRPDRAADGARAKFHNYGAANVRPPNPDLFMTTFNVRAQTGVNPHTAMKQRLRPALAARYRGPREDAMRIRRPAFYASARDVPRDRQLHMDGPFWVYWPSDGAFPPAYADLEKVRRQK